MDIPRNPGRHPEVYSAPNAITAYDQLNEAGKQLLKNAMEKLNLSARAYDRIIKVSRTIADLGNNQEIMVEHLAEAIQYRSLDRESWGS